MRKDNDKGAAIWQVSATREGGGAEQAQSLGSCTRRIATGSATRERRVEMAGSRATTEAMAEKAEKPGGERRRRRKRRRPMVANARGREGRDV